MKNLLVWQKLALLGAVFLIPLIVVSYALITSVENLGVHSARHELLGIEYAQALRPVLRDLQLVRGTSVAAPSDAARARGNLRGDLVNLALVDTRLHKVLQLSARQPSYGELCLKGLEAPSAPAKTDELAPISDQGIDLLKEVADRSELTLDPQLRSYYLMDGCMWKLPQHAEALTQTWTRLAGATSGKTLGATARNDLHRIAGLIGFLRAGANEALAKEQAAEPGHEKLLQLPEPAADPIAEALASDSWQSEPAALNASMTERLEADYKLADEVSRALTDLLRQRISELERRMTMSLVIGALGLLVVSALGWFLIRDITVPLGALATTARSIEKGEFDAAVTVGERRDEIGNLAVALRRMIDTQRESREGVGEKQHRHSRSQRNARVQSGGSRASGGRG